MRTIKFRAFDPNTGEVSEGKELYDFLQHNYDNWFGGRIHFKSGYYSPYSDCTIMQFTGLTDKNGVEIYEGDIVMDDATYFEVVWQHSRFDFKRLSGAYQSPFFHSNCGRMEVIGSIHTNPELLNS